MDKVTCKLVNAAAVDKPAASYFNLLFAAKLGPGHGLVNGTGVD